MQVLFIKVEEYFIQRVVEEVKEEEYQFVKFEDCYRYNPCSFIIIVLNTNIIIYINYYKRAVTHIFTYTQWLLQNACWCAIYTHPMTLVLRNYYPSVWFTIVIFHSKINTQL